MAERPRDIKRLSSVLVKLLVSVAAGYIVWREVGNAALVDALGDLSWPTLSITIGLLVFQQVLAALRWAAMPRAWNDDGLASSRLGWFIRTFWASQFVAQFLPGSIGSDIWRWMELKRDGVKMAPALASVLMDRMMGMMVLAFLTFISVISAFQVDAMTKVIALGSASLGLGLLVLPLLPQVTPSLFRRFPVLQPVLDIAQGWQGLLLNPGQMVRIVVMSGCIHSMLVVCAWIILRDLGQSVGWIGLFGAVCASFVVAALPLSLGGWGVREAAMVLTLGTLGVEPAAAAVVSLSLGFGLLLASLPGALFIHRQRQATVAK